MSHSFFVPCPRGLEEALAVELREIAARPEVVRHAPFAVHAGQTGGVAFSGVPAAAYAVNLHARIANRVLLRLAAQGYRSENDIYGLALAQRWEEHITPDQTIRVDVTAHQSPLRSLNFTALRIKDGICDRMRDKRGARPSVDTASPDARIFAHLTATDCTLYLDTSGDPLFKRGWRLEKGEAPLKETLAAGILRLSGWQPEQPFYDPMCGSGTFLIEAAQIALNHAPGAGRSFAFEWLGGFQPAAWQALRDAEAAGRRKLQPLLIAGSDISTDMLAITHDNWARAGLPGAAPLKQVDARFVKPPFDIPGVLLMNPPYGTRIAVRGARRARPNEQPDEALEAAPMNPREEEAANQFASAFATTLKQHFAGWTAYIFTGDLSLPRRMRLKESRRTPLFNGPIECRLFRFEMVRGGMRNDSPAEEQPAR